MKQFLFRLFALGILLFVCLIGYIRFGAYLLLDNKDKASIITTIELAPELPERFYELYETAYPKSLGTKLTENFFWDLSSTYKCNFLGADNKQ